jgi:excisionase family DNA binding protein
MAAELTKLPVRVVRDAAYNGALEARAIGNRVRIPVESIVAWLRTFDRATLFRIKKGRKS